MPITKEAAYKIIAHTAQTESGGKFASWNKNDNGAGISFGFIQFNQAGGRLAGSAGSSLAKLFRIMHSLDAGKFQEVMGPFATNLLDVDWVKHADLNAPDLKARIVASAAVPVFQKAQLELARQDYFAPAEETAAKYGIKSERGHALLFDTAVQWGASRMRKFAAEAAEALRAPLHGLGEAVANEPALLKAIATRADAGQYTRRAAILVDKKLSDASVVAGAIGLGTLALLGTVAWLLKPWRWFS
jgi:hypothetical protein